MPFTPLAGAKEEEAISKRPHYLVRAPQRRITIPINHFHYPQQMVLVEAREPGTAIPGTFVVQGPYRFL